MKNIRRNIERGFESLGHFLHRRRWACLGVLVLVLAALLSRLPLLTADTSNEGFLHRGDPVLETYTGFRDQFGRESMVVVGIAAPDVFDHGFLLRLRAFHEALEQEVPYLEEVTSLVNVRDTRGEGDELIVEDLLVELPEDAAAMEALRKRVLSSHLFPDYLISRDGRTTAVLLETLAYSPGGPGPDLGAGFDAAGAPDGGPVRRPVLTPEENTEVVRAVEAVISRFDAPGFSLHLSGGPVIDEFFRQTLPREVGQFLGLAVLVIGLFLFLLFRRVMGVILPLLVFVLSLACSLAVMALVEIPVKLSTTILPAFLLAVGVGSSVHLLTLFFRDFDRHGDKGRAIAGALGHSGLPIVMTGVTTAAGLFSFSWSDVAPVAELGWFGAAGVLIALVLTVGMGPVLLALWPMSPRQQSAAVPGTRNRIDRFLVATADFATSRAKGILIASALLIVIAGVGLTRVEFSHNPITWIPESSKVRRDFDRIDRDLRGTGTLEVIIDTKQENGLYDPGLLRQAEALTDFALAYRKPEGEAAVGKATSVLNVLKETHQALNENRAGFYAIPRERALVAQELLLFENSGSDDLEKIVDSRFQLARFTFKVGNDDAGTHARFVEAVQNRAEILIGDGAEITVTGNLMLFVHTMNALMRSMSHSYMIAGTVITVLMLLLIVDLRLGLLSMVPNLLPIGLTMGLVMGWFGIPMDAFTLLLGSVALGLSVDDTIHFFHNFRRYFEATGDVREAVRRTFLTAGRAMVFTTLVLVTGFWLFMLASLNNVFHFGLLTGVALILALLADFLLAPAIMAVVVRQRRPVAENPERLVPSELS